MAEIMTVSLKNDANLRAYYRLANVNDSSPNGFNLSASGSPTYVAGRFGNAVRLATGSDFVSIANDLGITGGACSISFWMKMESEISAGNSYIQQTDGGLNVGHSILYEYNAGTRRLYFRRSRWNVVHEGPTYNVSLGTVWHHIVYTYDGTNVRGYLDGALVAGPTAASGNGSAAGSDLFTLVGNTGSNPTLFDDVAVFNRALTATEVLNIFSNKQGFFQMF